MLYFFIYTYSLLLLTPRYYGVSEKNTLQDTKTYIQNTLELKARKCSKKYSQFFMKFIYKDNVIIFVKKNQYEKHYM